MSENHTVQISNPDLTITYFDSLDAAARHAFADNGVAGAGCMIAINAEKIMMLRKNPDLFDGCQDICFYPDGVAALYFVKRKYPRIPGVELWLKILARVQSASATICVFGASEGVSSKTERILSERFPAAKLTVLHGFRETADYETIVASQLPSVVFVAMGSPRQEQLIARLQRLSPRTLFMGIGGSLDVLTGRRKRAPALFKKNNMEFAYRLIMEPRRIFRQGALMKFLFLFYLRKFK